MPGKSSVVENSNMLRRLGQQLRQPPPRRLPDMLTDHEYYPARTLYMRHRRPMQRHRFLQDYVRHTNSRKLAR